MKIRDWMFPVIGLTMMALLATVWLIRSQETNERLRHNLKAYQDTTKELRVENGKAFHRLALSIQEDLLTIKELQNKNDSLGLALVVLNKEDLKIRKDGVAATVGQTVSTAGTTGTATSTKDSAVGDTLRFDKPPVTGYVSVLVRPRGFDWGWDLTPTPVPLRMTFACGKTGPEVIAVTPDWAKVDIGMPEVKDVVCTPRKGFPWGYLLTATTAIIFGGLAF